MSGDVTFPCVLFRSVNRIEKSHETNDESEGQGEKEVGKSRSPPRHFVAGPSDNYRMDPPRLVTPLTFEPWCLARCTRAHNRSARCLALNWFLFVGADFSSANRSRDCAARRNFAPRVVHRTLGLTPVRGDCCLSPLTPALCRSQAYRSLSLLLAYATGDANKPRVVGTVRVCVRRRGGARRVTSGANF